MHYFKANDHSLILNSLNLLTNYIYFVHFKPIAPIFFNKQVIYSKVIYQFELIISNWMGMENCCVTLCVVDIIISNELFFQWQ